MARLRFGTTIRAPREEVYRLVTAFGSEGPLAEDLFAEKHGEIIEQDGDTIVTQEQVETEEAITWQCTFRYPESRVMEAIDSTWSDRVDEFREVPTGTRWVVTFETKREGFVGAVQWLFFILLTGRRFRRAILGPVTLHFQGQHQNDGP